LLFENEGFEVNT